LLFVPDLPAVVDRDQRARRAASQLPDRDVLGHDVLARPSLAVGALEELGARVDPKLRAGPDGRTREAVADSGVGPNVGVGRAANVALRAHDDHRRVRTGDAHWLLPATTRTVRW